MDAHAPDRNLLSSKKWARLLSELLQERGKELSRGKARKHVVLKAALEVAGAAADGAASPGTLEQLRKEWGRFLRSSTAERAFDIGEEHIALRSDGQQEAPPATEASGKKRKKEKSAVEGAEDGAADKERKKQRRKEKERSEARETEGDEGKQKRREAKKKAADAQGEEEKMEEVLQGAAGKGAKKSGKGKGIAEEDGPGKGRKRKNAKKQGAEEAEVPNEEEAPDGRAGAEGDEEERRGSAGAKTTSGKASSGKQGLAHGEKRKAGKKKVVERGAEEKGDAEEEEEEEGGSTVAEAAAVQRGGKKGKNVAAARAIGSVGRSTPQGADAAGRRAATGEAPPTPNFQAILADAVAAQEGMGGAEGEKAEDVETGKAGKASGAPKRRVRKSGPKALPPPIEAGSAADMAEQLEALKAAGQRHATRTRDLSGAAEGLASLAAGEVPAGAEVLPGRSAGEAPLVVMPAEWQLPWDVDKRRTDAKKGPYSEQEHAAIHRAFTHYCSEHNLPTDNTNWLSENRSSDARGLWKYVARALPHRTIHSVCHAGHRLYAPRPREGKWEPHEDAQLLELVSRFGKSWVNVGQELGRYNSACRDRWKIISVEGIAKGRWSKEEEEQLLDAVDTWLRKGRGQVPANLDEVNELEQLDPVNWVEVAKSVPTRNATQCSKKWYEQLREKVLAAAGGDDAGAAGVGWEPQENLQLVEGVLKACTDDGVEYSYNLDWASVMPGKQAGEARKRWKVMLKQLVGSARLELSEQATQLYAIHSNAVMQSEA